MELYVHIFKLRNIRASYNPPTAQDSVRALSSDEVTRSQTSCRFTNWVEEWGGCFNNVSKGEGVIRRRQEPIFCFIRIILLYSSPTKTIRVSLLEYFTVNDASATIWQLHRAQTVDSIVLELRMQLNHCHCRWFSNRLFVSIQLIITMSITLSHNSEGGESWR